MGQTEAPPEIVEVVSKHAELEPDLVRPKAMARESRPVGGLLAFLDPLLGYAAFVVEPDDRATREGDVGRDEADAGRSSLWWCSILATIR